MRPVSLSIRLLVAAGEMGKAASRRTLTNKEINARQEPSKSARIADRQVTKPGSDMHTTPVASRPERQSSCSGASPVATTRMPRVTLAGSARSDDSLRPCRLLRLAPLHSSEH